MGRSITRAAGAYGLGLGLELSVIQMEAEHALKAILNMTQPATVLGCPEVNFSDRPGGVGANVGEPVKHGAKRFPCPVSPASSQATVDVGSRALQ